MAGPRQINIVSLFIYFLLAAGVYLSYKYVPVFMQKTELETLVKEISYSARGRRGGSTNLLLVQQAKSQLGIILDEEDIIVDRLQDRVKIFVVWRVVVKHPFGKVTRHIFQIEQETFFL